jgi:hypothetical protein
MRLEQAIYTSLPGPRLAGYQLAAVSPGISPSLARELTTWGPAHDALWDRRADARSVNFHPLLSGQWCLSWTCVAGEEYSGRGGGRVYTQMFILPHTALERFENDPFLILRALAAAGRLTIHDPVPSELPTVPLPGRGSASDPALTQQVLEEVTAAVFDRIRRALMEAPRVAVVTSGHVERLFQALIRSFPLHRRPAISFTTGLKDTPCRPLRLFVLPRDPSLLRQVGRRCDVALIDVAEAAASAAHDLWPAPLPSAAKRPPSLATGEAAYTPTADALR